MVLGCWPWRGIGEPSRSIHPGGAHAPVSIHSAPSIACALTSHAGCCCCCRPCVPLRLPSGFRQIAPRVAACRPRLLGRGAANASGRRTCLVALRVCVGFGGAVGLAMRAWCGAGGHTQTDTCVYTHTTVVSSSGGDAAVPVLASQQGSTQAPHHQIIQGSIHPLEATGSAPWPSPATQSIGRSSGRRAVVVVRLNWG